MKKIIYTMLCTFPICASVQAQVISKEKKISTFTSPNGRIEQCIALTKLPLGEYKIKDDQEENDFCNIDFYNNEIALCPKVWSTSPGTIVHSLSETNLDQQKAEDTQCVPHNNLKGVAKFKQTMNQNGTSGTFSGASILYYHFSRVLDSAVAIPTAVYRTMDKDSHLIAWLQRRGRHHLQK